MSYSEYQSFRFSILDYIVFFGMLLTSTATGIYFGFYKKRKVEDESNASSELSEYLLGSREMKIFPVAMSLISSYISGVSILGTTSEIYNYGTQYWLIMVPIILMAITVSQVYLPVFTTLRVMSSYEYLDMRFNHHVRAFASFLFVMDEIFFLPIILYVPSIALNQVTGINTHIISGGTCFACVVYTLLGGMKAVVHTDAWQTLVMFISVFVVIILGTVLYSGPVQIFKSAEEGGRLIFANFNPSFYERQSFWAVLIGGFCYWTSFNSVNQTMVQRYMSLPTLKAARQSIAIFTVGVGVFVSACCYVGLLVYDYYKKCDPLEAGLVQNDDQLLPVYVMQTIGHLQGMPGLFISGVFGAALSSLSVVLNSTALVVHEDIVRGFLKLEPSERTSTLIVKVTVVVLGCLAVSLVFLIEKLSGILGVATALTAIASSATFGVFTLGMLLPWSNSKGAIAGAVAGAIMSGWITFGTQTQMALGNIVSVHLNASVEDCMDLVNNTLPTSKPPVDSSNVFPLYRLSYHWVNPTGIVSVLLVGVIVSLVTGGTDLKQLDADLISPVMHRWLPPESLALKGVRAEKT